MKKDTTNILETKPIKIWEIREYKKGSLLENGIVLNETATFIYKLCNGSTSINKIIEMLVENYKVGPKRAEVDIIKCIKEFLVTDSIKLK